MSRILKSPDRSPAGPRKGRRRGPGGPRQSRLETRARLMAAAAELFAERGVDAVSLIEIGTRAGQRNRSAVQYHFGGKADLIAAIRDEHLPSITERRRQRLDALEARGDVTLRELVEALVVPLAEEVLHAKGGAEYLLLNTSLLGHPEFSPMSRERTGQPTPARLLAAIAGMTPELPRDVVGPRMRMVLGSLFHGLADEVRRARAAGGIDPAQWGRVVENMVDCLVAILESPATSRPVS